MALRAQAMLARLRALDGVTLYGGIQGAVAPGDATLPEMVEIATVQEYGSLDGRVPSRPFLRSALVRYGRGWSAMLARVMQPALAGDAAGVDLVWRRTALRMRADIQETLRSGPWQANAASTIRRKGSSMPLVNHGQLVNSIRVERVDGGSRETLA